MNRINQRQSKTCKPSTMLMEMTFYFNSLNRFSRNKRKKTSKQKKKRTRRNNLPLKSLMNKRNKLSSHKWLTMSNWKICRTMTTINRKARLTNTTMMNRMQNRCKVNQQQIKLNKIWIKTCQKKIMNKCQMRMTKINNPIKT